MEYVSMKWSSDIMVWSNGIMSLHTCSEMQYYIYMCSGMMDYIEYVQAHTHTHQHQYTCTASCSDTAKEICSSTTT